MHGQRRLVAGSHAHLGLGLTWCGVPLQQSVREIAPLHAFTDQRQFRLALDRHQIFDKRGDVREPAADQSR